MTRELTMDEKFRERCECGSPRSLSCADCIVSEYQAAHPDCQTCCPTAPRAAPHGTTETREVTDPAVQSLVVRECVEAAVEAGRIARAIADLSLYPALFPSTDAPK